MVLELCATHRVFKCCSNCVLFLTFIGFAFYFLAFLKYDKWNMIECDRIDERNSYEGEWEHTCILNHRFMLYETRRPSIMNEWMSKWTDKWMNDDDEWHSLYDAQVRSIGHHIDLMNKTTIARSDEEHKIKKKILPQEGQQRCWRSAMGDDENAYSWLLTEYSLVDLLWTYL